MGLIFEWDENKAKLNFSKHKVSFEEARTIFDDPFLMTFPDSEHSNYEQRYINIGISSRRRFLIVIYTEREENIRIISCRKATRSEQKFYEESI
jgi:uncharacterized DUF497 family protein